MKSCGCCSSVKAECIGPNLVKSKAKSCLRCQFAKFNCNWWELNMPEKKRRSMSQDCPLLDLLADVREQLRRTVLKLPITRRRSSSPPRQLRQSRKLSSLLQQRSYRCDRPCKSCATRSIATRCLQSGRTSGLPSPWRFKRY